MEFNIKGDMGLEDENLLLAHGDALELLKDIPSNSIDLIVADPPYFLSNGGVSNSGGKFVSVDKGEWDKNEDIEAFYGKFLDESFRILKDNGSIWVFGTMHNIYTLGYLFTNKRWKILNNITWQKTNPAPNLSCRMFTHSTETALWVRKSKGKHTFNYKIMRELNDNKQMKDVWTTSTTSKREKVFGKHPTQKPLALIKRIIEASSNEGDVVLDPFVGSGTTMVAAKQLNRKTIGFDIESEFIELTKERLAHINEIYEGGIK